MSNIDAKSMLATALAELFAREPPDLELSELGRDVARLVAAGGTVVVMNRDAESSVLADSYTSRFRAMAIRESSIEFRGIECAIRALRGIERARVVLIERVERAGGAVVFLGGSEGSVVGIIVWGEPIATAS